MLFIKKLVPLVFCILLSSCFPIVKLIYGIKNPKPKTESQLTKATLGLGLDTTPAYLLTNYGLYLYKNQFKKEDSTISVNQLQIIDKNQKLLLPKEQPGCYSEITRFID
tara:strand:+ start:4144 stop:4470 length:327 start_codon:yes stop_codon:yes gene_type:complete